MNLKKLGKKIGFTQNELRAVFFLLGAALLGLMLKYWDYNSKPSAEYAYAKQDSLFAEYGTRQKEAEKVEQKKVDSGKETFDFSKNKSNLNIKFVNRQICVNVNNASVEQLQTLPGIGIKTAHEIVAYRTENGKFKTKEELLNVKGIGKKKFEKIKSLIKIN